MADKRDVLSLHGDSDEKSFWEEINALRKALGIDHSRPKPSSDWTEYEENELGIYEEQVYLSLKRDGLRVEVDADAISLQRDFNDANNINFTSALFDETDANNNNCPRTYDYEEIKWDIPVLKATEKGEAVSESLA
ncbi:hypothetical protein ACF0H5_012259 [Mactra antiquata]